MLKANARRRILAAILLLKAGAASGLSNTEKSSYYRSVILLLCTVVESLVYELVKKHTIAPRHVVGEISEHKERHEIPVGIFSTSGTLLICEKLKKEQLIDDDGVGFGKLNVYLKNKGLISEREYKRLDSIRKERNRLHIQGLTVADTGYNRSKVEKVSKAIDFLLKKII